MNTVKLKRFADGTYRFNATDGRVFSVYKWHEWVAQCRHLCIYAETLKELKEKLSEI